MLVRMPTRVAAIVMTPMTRMIMALSQMMIMMPMLKSRKLPRHRKLTTRAMPAVENLRVRMRMTMMQRRLREP